MCILFEYLPISKEVFQVLLSKKEIISFTEIKKKYSLKVLNNNYFKKHFKKCIQNYISTK